MNTIAIATQLWQQLWLEYRHRVPYARIYQEMIEASQSTIANDHIAFRSLSLTVDGPQGPINLGISYIEDLIKQLGYCRAGVYEFPEQHLVARHYVPPPSPEWKLPKLFISELKVNSLPTPIATLIRAAVSWTPRLNPSFWRPLPSLSVMDAHQCLSQLQSRLSRIWSPPLKSTVERVNQVSQYGAWVLCHGYSVNHFAGYINQHHLSEYSTLEITSQALEKMGVPMKTEIEGSLASGLRQTATKAIVEPVSVTDSVTGQTIQMQWPYAYFELAERYPVEPNSSHLFDGFLSQQAQALFEMTRHR